MRSYYSSRFRASDFCVGKVNPRGVMRFSGYARQRTLPQIIGFERSLDRQRCGVQTGQVEDYREAGSSPVMEVPMLGMR